LASLALKETKVSNNQLMTTNNRPVRMQQAEYFDPLKFDMDSTSLASAKYISVPVTSGGVNSTLQIDVTSFIKIPNKKIIFIGVLYSVIVDTDGYTVVQNDANFNPFQLANQARSEPRVVTRISSPPCCQYGYKPCPYQCSFAHVVKACRPHDLLQYLGFVGSEGDKGVEQPADDHQFPSCQDATGSLF